MGDNKCSNGEGKKNKDSNKLNRFTSLPVLFDLLSNKRIVLRDSSTWEDKNDVELILEYKRRKQVSKIFAICFANGPETIHLWKAYADGIYGCCIEFDKEKLLKSFPDEDKDERIQKKKVVYRPIDDNCPYKCDDIPFFKRLPYWIEEEYRIIWAGETEEETKEFEIDLTSITKITLSPRMPACLYYSTKNKLKNFYKLDCEINHSTILKNDDWITKFKQGQCID
jgi:hypothetical protein